MANGLTTRSFVLLLCLAGAGSALPSFDTTLSRAQYLRLLDRSTNTCPSSDPVSCAAVDPNLPSDFCCAAGTTCISIDSSSSALCCPANGSCINIQPIECDITLQDASTNVGGPVYTTKLNAKLPACGDGCCPLGYTCGQRSDGSSACVLDKTTAVFGTANSGTSSASSTQPTAKSSVSAKSSGPSLQSSTIGPINATTNRSLLTAFPPGVFLAGFFPGMALGILCLFAWVICSGRLKKKRAGDSGFAGPYPPKPNAANPFADPAPDAYTQPPRKNGAVVRSTKDFFGKDRTQGTPGLPFDKADQNWKELTPPNNHNIPPIGFTVPAGPGARMPANRRSGSVPGGINVNVNAANAANTIKPRAAPGIFPESPKFGESVTSPGLPVARSHPRVNYMTREEAVDEVLRIYSPQTVERPKIQVAPVRGMNTKRRSIIRDSGLGYDPHLPRPTPITPNLNSDDEKKMDSIEIADRPIQQQQQQQKQPSPSRYDGVNGYSGQAPVDPTTGSRARPETSFTEMLEQVGFPDPAKNGGVAPVVPKIPQRYK